MISSGILRLVFRRGQYLHGVNCRVARWFGYCGLFIMLCTNVVGVEAASVSRLTGKVVKVMDGDSFFMRSGAEVYEVRLWGIDCPEKKQDYGNEARSVGKKLLSGQTVKVEVVGKDSYDRYLGLVYRGRLLVNEELIVQGAAWVYRRYCQEELCARWLEVESQARQHRRGLWAKSNPVPPWKWRRK